MPTLVIKELKCHNMSLPGHKGPNAFIIIDVDGNIAKTITIKGERHPKWTQEIKIRIKDPRSCIVRFMVFDEGLLETKRLGSHMTTIGHLFKGQPATQKVIWELCKADFCYTLLAKDFGIEMPTQRSADHTMSPEPIIPKGIWDCQICENVNTMATDTCLRCGVARGAATVERPQ